tara:strand:- start:76 stop:870 length:795 start_codon:yes stop_codon:yes gene_type:complete
MPENEFSPSPTVAGSLRVEGLAKRVIDELGKKSPADTRDRVVETTLWISNVTTTVGNYVQSDVLSALVKRGVSRDLIVDCCLPDAARLLGDGWMKNLRSFGQVSLGTVRIQALLQELSNPSENNRDEKQIGGLLLIACQSEDHTLGPLILADQLRRKGYSINILIGADEEEIIKTSSNSDFDGIMFSCSGIRAFDEITKLINKLKDEGENLPPLILGGKVIDVLKEKIHGMIDVDLITKDVGIALQFLKTEKNQAGKNRVERAS